MRLMPWIKLQPKNQSTEATFPFCTTSGRLTTNFEKLEGDNEGQRPPHQAYIQKRHAQVTIPTTRNKNLHLYRFSIVHTA